MAPNFTLDWRGKHVALVVEEGAEEGLVALAFWIEGQAKINVTQNGQVDTGFMRNAIAAFSRSRASASATSGRYQNRRGRMVARIAAGQVPLPSDAVAGVHAAASYSIYQEERRPFLYPALVEGARTQQGVIVTPMRHRVGSAR